MVKKIKLTQGKYALVDDEDYPKVSKYKWCAYYNPHTKSYYAIRNTKINEKWTSQRMHRFILGVTDPNIQVDHIISGNTLDNRKSNLRVVTHNQNMWNQRKPKLYAGKPTSSIYKGVSWNKKAKKWKAEIKVNNKYFYLGLYKNEKDAALAYNKAARKYFGKYALLNKIDGGA